MSRSLASRRWLLPAFVVVFVSCQDLPEPVGPMAPEDGVQASHGAQEVAAWFALSAREALAVPRTVFADHDEAANRLVFGVENAQAARGVENVLAARGIPASAYTIEVTEPIRFMSETLRTRHRPTRGGIQIHFGNYLCTLGFNADHSGGRSFITNSHCTNQQGQTDGTTYYQPTSSADPGAIAVEVDDPAYFRGGACSVGKVCRYSDAARALYDGATASNRGDIAKTTGVNNGDLSVAGSFTVGSQDNATTHFSGTIDKVGRTTGWTQGEVTNTCARVNVSGSNIQLLCQTLVQRSGTQIVGSGDSGSPVFKVSGVDQVQLVGILWGGSSSGDLFVFSPLKNIQDELGGLTATADGTGGGSGGGDEDGGDGGEPCVPKGPNGKNCK